MTLIIGCLRGDEAIVTLGKRGDDGDYAHSYEDLAVFFSRSDARDAGVPLGEDERGEPV